jgi:hypothetical protein
MQWLKHFWQSRAAVSVCGGASGFTYTLKLTLCLQSRAVLVQAQGSIQQAVHSVLRDAAVPSMQHQSCPAVNDVFLYGGLVLLCLNTRRVP